MVRVKSNPSKRIISDVESVISHEEASSPSASEEAIPPTPILRHIFTHDGMHLDITLGNVPDERHYALLSSQKLMSLDNCLTLENASLVYEDRMLFLTYEVGGTCQSHISKPITTPLFYSLKRLIKAGELVFSLCVEQCHCIYIRASIRLHVDLNSTSTSTSSFFMPPDLYQWLVNENTVFSSSSNLSGASDVGFSAIGLMDKICRFSTQDGLQSHGSDTHQLREKIRTAGLLPELRDYQLAGVRWMMGREGGVGDQRVGLDMQGWSILPRTRPKLWVDSSNSETKETTSPHEKLAASRCCEDKNGCEEADVWYNCLTGEGRVVYLVSTSSRQLVETEVEADGRSSGTPFDEMWTPPSDPLVCGGVLADEPGLGKTVELLGLILVQQLLSEERTSEEKVCKREEEEERERSMSTVAKDESVVADSSDKTEAGVGSSVCVCMRDTFRKKLHKGWVQCDVCNSYSHITCAGSKYSCS